MIKDKDFQVQLFAAVMEKTVYPTRFVIDENGAARPTGHTWSPSLDGEATKEVRDWFAKEMPEEWEKYLQGIAISPAPQRNNDTFFTETYDRQSSITNLAQYIVEHPEMFYEECPKRTKNDVIDCYYDTNCDFMMNCNGTGKRIKPRFAEAVRVIEDELKK